LNAIFHVEASPGNLAWADYEAVRRHPLVKTALPIAVGDNYRGYRLVGTLPDLLQTVGFAGGRTLQLETGRFISGPEAKEAVVGSFAAQKLGLHVGDRFHPYHGLDFNPAAQHEDEYEVVGVAAPTNTPIDRVIWIPIEGLQTMIGHDPKTASEISAVLIQLRTPAAGFMLDQLYNRQGNRLTFAYPVGTIVAELFARISWFDRILTLVAYVVALVAAASVLASIYNSMAARRRDLAILRALGAHRRTIFGAVVFEAASIGLVGAVAGAVVYIGLFTVIAQIVRAQTGVVLDVAAYDRALWLVPAAMIALCAAGGVVPAIKGYRTPVAETLAPLS
jgi:putative ABC transport system permease protein